jgi:hypothetical protein
MQREGQVEINLSRAFAKNNSNILAEASTPKKNQKGLQYQMLTIGDFDLRRSGMVDAMNSIDVNCSEEDNGVEETGK